VRNGCITNLEMIKGESELSSAKKILKYVDQIKMND